MDGSENNDARDQAYDIRIFEFRFLLVVVLVVLGGQLGEILALLLGNIVLGKDARQEDEHVDDGQNDGQPGRTGVHVKVQLRFAFFRDDGAQRSECSLNSLDCLVFKGNYYVISSSEFKKKNEPNTWAYNESRRLGHLEERNGRRSLFGCGGCCDVTEAERDRTACGSDEETCGEQVPPPRLWKSGHTSVEGETEGEKRHGDHGQDANGAQFIAQIAHDWTENELRQRLGSDKQTEEICPGCRIHLKFIHVEDFS